MLNMKFLTLEDILAAKIKASKPDPGFVYGVRNEHMPGLAKIGLTRVGVSDRIQGLGTASPRPWTVVASIQVKHVAAVEKALHEFFRWYRVDEGREFFKVENEQIENTFQICFGIDGASADQPLP